VSQDTLAMTTAQCIEKTGPAVSAHEDEIGVGLPGSLKNRFDDVALLRFRTPRPSSDSLPKNRTDEALCG